MAIPTIQSTNGPRDPGFMQIMRLLANIRVRTRVLFDQSAAGPTQLEHIIVEYYANVLVAGREELEALIALPGMQDYATSEFPPGSGIDIAAEWTNAKNQINSVISWIEANAPLNNIYSFAAGGGLNKTVVSTSATAGLRTELQKILDAIEPPA